MRNWRVKGRGADRRVTATFEPAEIRVLRSLAQSLLDLLDERASSAPQDDLAELTGIRTGHSSPPPEGVLGRLLPDFARDVDKVDDGADFVGAMRSVNEPLLLDAKSEALTELLRTLPDSGPVALTFDSAEQWLTALNDIRLALGVMLGISDESPEELPADHPQADNLNVYHWLSAVQELLVTAIMDGR